MHCLFKGFKKGSVSGGGYVGTNDELEGSGRVTLKLHTKACR